ncbi:MAG: ABC transporter permease [Planctomycetota bacterium]|nr:ABC transporter permease [Planctomycetota bacterium]
MLRFVGRRIAQMPATIAVIITLSFFLVRLAPGDPARAMAGEMADPDNIEAIREAFGLNLPLWQQFLIYLRRLASLDFGYSFGYRMPVSDIILERMPRTLLLMLVAIVASYFVGVLLGTLSASKYPSAFDTGVSTVAVTLYSLPVFWLGMILIRTFSTTLGWFPSGGMHDVISPQTGFGHVREVAWHMVLPVTALSAYNLPLVLRITRASVIETLGEEYVLTARATGLSHSVVFYKHALRNALLPSITTLGLLLGWVLTGAILTETVFSWPGLGLLLKEAIAGRDYPVLMGIFTFSSVLVVVVSFLTDIAYAALDPRVRLVAD